MLSKEKCEVLLLGWDPHAPGRAGSQVVQPAKEQPNSSYNYLKGGYKDSGDEPFLVVAESIRRSNGHNFQVRTFTLDISKKFFIERVTQHWIRPLGEAVVSILGGFQDLARQSHSQACTGDSPALSRRVE